MKKNLTRAAIAVIVVVIGTCLWKRDRNRVREITSETLKPQEKAAVIFDPGTGRVTKIEKVHRLPGSIRGAVQSGGDVPVVVEHIDGAREVRVSVGENGEIKLTARYRGFCFDPGFGLVRADTETRYSLDAEVAFSRRHGLYLGINAPVKDARRIRGQVAYGYTLPFRHLTNTTLLIGLDTSKEVVYGIRVKF
jgi:hypothetical protein